MTELVAVGMSKLWEYFKDGVISACDELCEENWVGETKKTHGGGMKM